jgi:hypothetical protein
LKSGDPPREIKHGFVGEAREAGGRRGERELWV